MTYTDEHNPGILEDGNCAKSSTASVNLVEDSNLKRRLNAIHGAALIVGATVGSGIFTNPPDIFKAAGAASALMAWVLGAIIAFFGAMIYGEWACRIPMSGGDAPFLDNAYKYPPRMITFLYSFSRVLAINPGYVVFQAWNFSKFCLEGFFPNLASNLGKSILSAVVITVLSFICVLSNRVGSSVFLALTLLSILIVLFISFVGFLILVGAISIEKAPSNFDNNPWSINGANGLSTLFLYTLWAYDGWSNLASSVGEIKNPHVNVRLANFFGIGAVAFVYILANVAYVLVLDKDSLTDAQMMFLWARKLNFMGAASDKIVSSAVMSTTLSCCFTMIYSSSRIAQATGESNLILFPRFFARLSNRFGTPVNAILVNWAIALLIAGILSVVDDANSYIIEGVGLLFWLFCLLTVIGLLIVKYREKAFLAWRRPANLGVHVHFSIPLSLSLIIIAFLIMLLNSKTTDMLIFFGCSIALTLSGLIPYYFLSKKGHFTKTN